MRSYCFCLQLKEDDILNLKLEVEKLSKHRDFLTRKIRNFEENNVTTDTHSNAMKVHLGVLEKGDTRRYLKKCLFLTDI